MEDGLQAACLFYWAPLRASKSLDAKRWKEKDKKLNRSERETKQPNERKLLYSVRIIVWLN